MFAFYNGDDAGVGKYAIGMAHSIDGVTWVRDPRNPILTFGATWEDDHVKEPKCLIVDNVLYLYYVGYNGAAYQVGLARSWDYGKTWVRYASNPVIALGSADEWDDAVCRFPVVLYDADDVAAKRFKLWYAGEETKDAAGGAIGYAYSADGLTWTKSAQNPLLEEGAAAEWDDFSVYPGAVYKVGTTYYLFYGGKNNSTGFWQVGLATFTDPEGTYTKHDDNPMVARESARAEALTSDLTAGTAAVAVADTSEFSVGEYVLVGDDDSDSELNRILSIDSSTAITLRDNVVGGFTTAQNAEIRSLYYASLFPMGVWREGDKWVMSLTAFQIFSDHSDLREYGAFARADVLTGPWELDIQRGVVLEPDAETSTWDTASMENFDVHPVRFSPMLDLVAAMRVERDDSNYPVIHTKATPPGTRVRRTGNQPIADATQTAVSWTASSVGYGDMWESVTNPTRVTAQQAGVYLITATVAFAPNATGSRVLSLKLSGTSIYIAAARQDAPDATQNTFLTVSTTYYLDVGDYVEAMVDQDSGGNLDVVADSHRSPQLSVWKIAGF